MISLPHQKYPFFSVLCFTLASLQSILSIFKKCRLETLLSWSGEEDKPIFLLERSCISWHPPSYLSSHILYGSSLLIFLFHPQSASFISSNIPRIFAYVLLSVFHHTYHLFRLHDSTKISLLLMKFPLTKRQQTRLGLVVTQY